MPNVQGDACDDCIATVTVTTGRGLPGVPMSVHVVHARGCEWFERNATMGPGSRLTGGGVVAVHTSVEGAE